MDGCGSDTLFEYDSLGRLVREQTPLVNGERYEKLNVYDDKKNTVTAKDENGVYTRAEYTSLGLAKRIYLAQGELPTERDILTKEYVYDEYCRLITEIRYDGEGTLPRNIISTTKYQYDSYDRVAVKEIPQVRYYETHEYEDVCALPYAAGSLGSLHETRIAGEDNAPEIVARSYSNRLGFEEAQYLGGDLKVRYAFDLAGNKLSQTDALGNTVTFAVDYAGRTVSVTKPFGASTVTATTVYDSLGNRTSVTDFLGNTATYTYDKAGRLLKSVTPFDSRNTEMKNKYDACGRLTRKDVQVSGRDWRSTSYCYDGRGRLIDSYACTVSSGNNWVQVHTEYDGNGNKLSVASCETGFTDNSPAWQTQSYTYDRFNNVLTFTDYAGEVETNVYDAVGRLLRKTLRDGTVQSFEYDALGRVIREQADMPDASAETPTVRETEYTRTGQKKRQVQWEKNVLKFYSAMDFSRLSFCPLVSEYRYNAKGQLIEQTDPNGERKEYTYDLNGNRTRFKLYREDSVEASIDLQYTYDNSNELTSVTSGETVLASYTYDANGRKTGQSNANGTTTAYTYNLAGLVTKLENKLGNTVISAWDYEYRLDGVQTSKTDKDGLKTAYTYDLVGRLVQEQQSTETEDANGDPVVTVTSTIAYVYDQYGNRTSVTATGFPAYTETYLYDSSNRLTSRTRTEDGETHTTVNTYDENGNLTRSVKDGTDTVTRAYNGFGQQVSYIDADKEIWFRYRPDGLRFSKQILTGSGANQTSVVTTHYWDGSDIVAEASTNGTLKATYLRGNGELIAEQIGTVTSYYLHNAHGNVVQRTDASGGVLKSYVYDAFGNIMNPAVVGNPLTPIYVDQSPFGYCGEYLDKETGEIYLRARYYDSSSGRFTCEDSQRIQTKKLNRETEAIDGLALNLYGYCNDDPVNHVDPSGEIAFLLVTALVGAAIGAVVGGVRAAKQGKSVLGGVLKGAVIGGAIGLGVGALAGAALAGSVVASTAAVIAGAKTVAVIAATSEAAAATSQVGGNFKSAGQQITQAVSTVFSGGSSSSASTATSSTSTVAETATKAADDFTKYNFRQNLQQLTGNIGQGLQAHHVFPQKFVNEFVKIGIKINDPVYGAWVDASHQSWSYAYNQAWIAFFDSGIAPTKEGAYLLATELASKYGFTLNF